jgi:hypothetical protein
MIPAAARAGRREHESRGGAQLGPGSPTSGTSTNRPPAPPEPHGHRADRVRQSDSDCRITSASGGRRVSVAGPAAGRAVGLSSDSESDPAVS